MSRFEAASIYVRQEGIRGVRYFDGPFPLPRAHEAIREFAEEELGGLRMPDYKVLYYELRGLEGCSVRYRLWIERPPDYLRTEVVTACGPGGHVQGWTSCDLVPTKK